MKSAQRRNKFNSDRGDWIPPKWAFFYGLDYPDFVEEILEPFVEQVLHLSCTTLDQSRSKGTLNLFGIVTYGYFQTIPK